MVRCSIGLQEKQHCRFWRAVGLLVLLLLFYSVGLATAAVTEKEVLQTIVTKGADPSLERMANGAKRLRSAVNSLCKKKDTSSLEEARKAWQEAYLSWRQATPFLIGAAKKLKARYRIGRWWMLNEKVLDAVVTSKEYKNLRGNVDVHGFSAVEYLLFTPKTGAEATANERCLMLRANTEEIVEILTTISREWLYSGLREKILAAGDGEPFLLPSDALEVFLGESINASDQMLRDSIGLPSGYFNSIAKPDLLEAWHSRNSLESLKAILAGLRLALIDEQGVSALVAEKDGLLAKRNPELALRFIKDFNAVKKAIDNIGGVHFDLHKALEKKPKRLKPLYEKMEQLQKTLIEVSLQLELDIMMPGEVGD